MLATLRQRDFGLLWLGGLISLTGSWALIAALPFFVYEQTGSALASGAVFAIETLPFFLFGSIAGVFVDRWDRKRVLVGANASQALATLPMLVTGLGGPLWVVYVSAFLVSSIGTLVTPAENALLPRLVGHENLMAANSLNSLNDNLARVIGPAAGGVLVSQVGLGGVVIADVATFFVAAAMIAVVRTSGVPEARLEEAPGYESGSWLDVPREWAEGLRLVVRDRLVSGLFVVTGVALVADGLLTALLAPFVDEVLLANGAVFGLILACRGAGGLLGGVAVGFVSGRVRPARLLPVSLIVLGALVAAFVSLPSLPASLTIATLFGIPAVGWLASQQTLLQNSVADRYLGRIFGAFTTINALTVVVGYLLAGALADLLGIVPLLYASAAVYALAGLLAFPLLRRKTEN